MARVVVLGAGPAGLAATWHAARRGHDVVLLEASERPGGMARTHEVGGQRVDLGSHRLHPSTDPALLGDLRALLGDDLQRRRRHGRIRLADRWLAFPLRATDLLRSLPPGLAARAGLDVVVAPLRRPRDDSFASVVSAGLGPTVSAAFYRPYARKLWDADWHDLDGELARRRVGTRSPGAVLRRLLAARDEGGEGQQFLYPRQGFGRIADALASAAVATGADVRTATPVVRVRARPDGVTVDGRGAGPVEADVVLSTLPLRSLLAALQPTPPDAVTVAAASLRVRAMVLLYLVVPRDRYTDFDAHYLPGPETVVSRLSEPKNYRDGDDPVGTTVVCCEIPCWEGDDTWRAGTDELAARVASELRALGLPDPDAVAAERIGLPSVYPVYDRGFADRLAVCERWLAGLPRLVTLGRQGLFALDNTHHALAMGCAAAAVVRPDGTVDRAAWEAARDAFRSHVVED